MDEGLYAQIAATPDVIDPYLVLADQLQLRGDPRGDLIVVQRALESAIGLDATELRKREEAFDVGQPIDAAHRKDLAVQWRWGFIHRAASRNAAAVASLLAAPHVASTLVELHLERNATRALAAQLAELDKAWPRSLRRLYLHPNERGFGAPFDEPIEMPAAQSPLEELALCGAFGFAAQPSLTLRRLELRSKDLDLAALAAFEWPVLAELVLETNQIELAFEPFPQLRRLAVRNTYDTDALVERLIAHPIMRQLTHLDLSGGTMTAEAAALLAPFAERIAIDTRRNLIRGAKAQRPQRAGHRSLGMRDEQLSLQHLARNWTRADRFPAAKQLQKANDAALLLAPAVAIRERAQLAAKLTPAAEKLAASRALHAELDTVALTPRHAEASVQLLGSIALACEELDDLFGAELARWRQLREARWIDDTRSTTAASGHIATLRMRRGDPTTAAPLLAKVEASYRDTKDRPNEAWALRQRGNVELTRSNFGEAERLYRSALAIYEELDDKHSQGLVLSELSSAYWYRSDFAGAETMLRKAIELTPAGVGLGSTYYNLGAILNGANRLDDAIEAGTKALEIFTEHAHPGGQGQALSLLGELWQRNNQHARAMEHLERALALERVSGRRRELGITLGNVSRVALDLGDWDKARECCEEAVEIHREVSNKYNEGMQLTGLGDAALGMGDLDEADTCYFDALVPLKAIDSHIGVSSAHLRRGIVAHLSGKREVAIKYYRQALGDAAQSHDLQMPGWIEMWIALLAAQAGDQKAATAALGRAHAAIPAASVQGNEALAMTDAVVARLLGETTNIIPEPQSWDSRIIARLAQ